MKEKYYILEKHYGNHSQVAKALGMSARNYRNIRNEHHPPKTIMAANVFGRFFKASPKDFIK